jgi:peptide/nickel transport system permease protein
VTALHAAGGAQWRRALRGNGVATIALLLLLAVALLAACAPWLATMDPQAIDPGVRNRPPGFTVDVRTEAGTTARRTYWMGTDSLGRDVYSRTLHGARVSLVVGAAVATASIALGLLLGLAAGYFRAADAIVMRIMDGLMAIPAILMALAIVSLTRAGLAAVIVAIVIPEVPRVVRLVRAVVLTTRSEAFVEASVAIGTPPWRVLWWHVVPATLAPLAVQGTYVAASAILVEAILSFLGVGIAPETPTWGNIMAEGRSLFRLYPHTILLPGAFLALTVLAVNLLGDRLRDVLDPRLRHRLQGYSTA